MTRVDDFDSFYATTARATLQLTYALCGDRNVAVDATADAYRHSWRSWDKISTHDPHAYTRTEAWRLTSRERATHPLRRRQEDDSDAQLLESLADLPSDGRRLLALMTLGDIDLEDAAREVGIGVEEAIELTTEALTGLEASLGESIDGLERRVHALAAVTGVLELPPVTDIRTSAKRSAQRNLVALIAASIAVVVACGLAVTPGSALTLASDSTDREKIGAETTDQVLRAEDFEASQLLSTDQLSLINEDAPWKASATDEDPLDETPYATCPPERFSNPDPLRTFVRTYRGDEERQERVAQAVEISDTAEEADKSYQEMVTWFADCQQSRVQLLETYKVERPTGDFQIMSLRSNRDPTRTFTVGLSHSGTLALALVHEVDGTSGPDIEDFAATLNRSVLKLCEESGGICSRFFKVEKTTPPAIEAAPGFLAVVDLPPVAKVNEIWQGTKPSRDSGNPAATVCDEAKFDGDEVEDAASRIFVMPQASELPEEFGVAESVARFSSEDSAKEFADKTTAKIDGCPDDNLSASLDQEESIDSDGVTGKSWRIGLQLDEGDQRAYFRTAIIRKGANVAQVTFTSTENFDMSQEDFTAIAQRSGQRITYMR